MPAPSRSTTNSLLRWLLLGAATVAALVAQLQQQVDPSNRALKAPGTNEARARQALARVVASEQIVLLAWSLPGDLPLVEHDTQAIASVCEHLATLPGVLACQRLPSAEPDLALVTVALAAADAAGAAERVVTAATAHMPAGMLVQATGLPLVEARLAELVAGERRTLVPLLGAFLFAAAWIVYRRLRLAVAALLPALLAIVWTNGLYAVLGHRLDPVGALLDPVLLTIGVATSVHFVEAWRRHAAAGWTATTAARRAARTMRMPTLLATATTMVGLLSLLGNAVPAVADFGVRAALGIALVHGLVFALLPAWLAHVDAADVQPRLRHALGAAWLRTLRRHGTVSTLGAAAVTTAALLALPHLRSDNDPLRLLPQSEPSRAAYDRLAARLGGVEVFHVLAPQGTPGTELARLVPFLADVSRHDGCAGPAGPLLRSSEGDLAAPLLLRPSGSRRRTALFDDFDDTALALGLDHLVPAGASVQIARDSQRLVHSLLGSTLVTVLLLGAGMCIGLRSLRLGLIGMVPTVLPCLWVYGGLAMAGEAVTVATGMIACTMLGLLVDNTVHFLHHYRSQLRRHPARAAVRASLQHVGRPMLLSSALLIAGFAVGATSRLTTTVQFSVLACTTIAAALVATGVLLPLLLLALADRSAEPTCKPTS